MAYINAEKTREIAKKLKAAFPDFKFSVRNEHHTSVYVSILAAPMTFNAYPDQYSRNRPDMTVYRDEKHTAYHEINHHYPNRYENAETLKKIITIVNDGNHDNSDVQTDYFDVGWYVTLAQGKWDKPFRLITKEK